MYISVRAKAGEFNKVLRELHNFVIQTRKLESIMLEWAIFHFSDAKQIIQDIWKVDDETAEQQIVWWAYRYFVKRNSNRGWYERWLKSNNLWEIEKYRQVGIYHGFIKAQE